MHWFALLLLNVLCLQGENGDRGIKGEKGDSHGDFFVSGPPGLPGSPGLVVSSDFSSPFSSVSHSLPLTPPSGTRQLENQGSVTAPQAGGTSWASAPLPRIYLPIGMLAEDHGGKGAGHGHMHSGNFQVINHAALFMSTVENLLNPRSY